MPFDMVNKGKGGGGDPAHDPTEMALLIGQNYKAFIAAGAASGLCRKCATINLIALMLTDLIKDMSDDQGGKCIEKIIDKTADWVVLNQEEGSPSTLIIRV